MRKPRSFPNPNAPSPACSLLLEGCSLSFQPPGRDEPLFDDVDVALGPGLHILVGRNGVGKSVLAEILAGVRTPDGGHVLRAGSIGYLPQHPAAFDGTCAEFFGVADELAALARAEEGILTPEDQALLDGKWGLHADLEQEMATADLSVGILGQEFQTLSGGERTRLALLAVAAQDHAFLILDEPTNHLDRIGRRWFADWIGKVRGALIVTHDRLLTNIGHTIFELDTLGLHGHRASWSEFVESRQQQHLGAARAEKEAAAACAEAARARTASSQAAAGRASQGRSQRGDANLSKITLNHRKEISERTDSRRVRLHAERHAQALERLETARRQLERVTPVRLPVSEPLPTRGQVARLRDVVLAFGCAAPISLELPAGERMCLVGANGSGKSTFLKLLRRDTQARSGEITVTPHVGYLDQDCSLLIPDHSALMNFTRLAPGWAEDRYRTVLAQVRLRREMALSPTSHLSGGERMKVALVCLLCGPAAPALLLLDEPDNHLDLEARGVLERALADYRGALVVVSHDDEFIAAAGVSRRFVFEGSRDVII